jgi:hypothetical protein
MFQVSGAAAGRKMTPVKAGADDVTVFFHHWHRRAASSRGHSSGEDANPDGMACRLLNEVPMQQMKRIHP